MMKLNMSISALERVSKLLFIVVGLAVFAAPCYAQKEKVAPSVLAIVDVQRVLQESTAAKGVQGELERQRSSFQAEITKEEESLRKAEQKLAKMRDKAKADEYVEAEQKLRARFMKVERQVQQRRKELDKAFSDSMARVKKGIVDVVKAVSKAHGVNIAIVKQQVIWNDHAIDITDEVLARLNKEMPHIKVETSQKSSQPSEK